MTNAATISGFSSVPAFSAYASAGQTLSANTWTKVQFNTKEFDTNNNYDATTNYRFTPTVAGYYQVNAYLGFNTTNSGQSNLVGIYKNGVLSRQGSVIPGQSSSYAYAGIAALVYFNGSTDYIECFAYSTGGSIPTSSGNSALCYFQAALVRSA